MTNYDIYAGHIAEASSIPRPICFARIDGQSQKIDIFYENYYFKDVRQDGITSDRLERSYDFCRFCRELIVCPPETGKNGLIVLGEEKQEVELYAESRSTSSSNPNLTAFVFIQVNTQEYINRLYRAQSSHKKDGIVIENYQNATITKLSGEIEKLFTEVKLLNEINVGLASGIAIAKEAKESTEKIETFLNEHKFLQFSKELTWSRLISLLTAIAALLSSLSIGNSTLLDKLNQPSHEDSVERSIVKD